MRTGLVMGGRLSVAVLKPGGCEHCAVLFFFHFIIFSLEYNCFTMLCWFLLHNSINQLQVCICSLPLKRPSDFPHSTPLGHHSAQN